MSFSFDVKKELCNITLENKNQMYAECYGMLLFAKKFSAIDIVLKTENIYVADRFSYLLSELFGVIIEKKSSLKSKTAKTQIHKVQVLCQDDCKKIFEHFGHQTKDINLRINRGNLENENLYADFLRGAFLSCGSVNDPNKGYHLELAVKYKALTENTKLFLNEFEVFTTPVKSTARNGGYVIYLKGNTPICDFLGYIGAGNSVMFMIETLAYKEIRNKINRKRNSEVANLQKLASASAVQITAIKKIDKLKGMDFLPDDLKELAKLRLLNPEMSLKELGENLQTPISRSGVNHRLQKLLKIAEGIDK